MCSPLRMVGLGLLLGSMGSLIAAPPVREKEAFWAFTPPRQAPLPRIHNSDWCINPIDAFILAKLEGNGLGPNAPADRLTLLRRVTFDLTGLPPTLAEQEAFLKDPGSQAYEKAVDRLLASPHYGEHWAQHWLDLARYAETNGFKSDEHRANAYRYRDYVIGAFNEDLPYDRFIRQQLAGDELEPDNPRALVATGFLRLHPDESNAANLEQRRQEILDDVTDVAGQVFLGLTMGCARCHDHKFDPIPQSDYYRLQAFFAPMQQRDDLFAATPGEAEAYRSRLANWDTATADLRKEMDSMLAGKRLALGKTALEKFRPEIQQAVQKPDDKRTPYEKQIARMALKQLHGAEQAAPSKLAADQKKRYQELERQLAARRPERPASPPIAMAVSDIGAEAPPTYLLMGGDWHKPREELQPGFPEVLPQTPLDLQTKGVRASTGRRAALARWLTQPRQPLTARVLVNRLWQDHFGRGIVATPSDFGSQGEPPTHPELLDWLALDFVQHGWSLKYLHKLMVTSATYRQSARADTRNPAWAADRENKLFWHARPRRLEGEALRDAMLLLSGDLNPRMLGPSCKPELPERISTYAWKPDPQPSDRQRRSIYVLAKRNMRYPLFDAFDLPDMHNSCARRTQTTTAPQALLMLNGAFALDQARRWSDVLQHCCSKDEASLVALAYRMAWGRPATDQEVHQGLAYLHRPGVTPADFCHALLNTNEFLYID